MSGNVSCNVELDDYLRFQCGELEDARLERHIATCSWCQSKLDTAAGDAAFRQEVQQSLSTQFSKYQLFLVETQKEAAATRDDPTAWTDKLIELLGPPDDPQMLGRLGSYEVSAIIGRGGTGVVLKALEPRLGRYVAIKVLSPEFANSGAAIKRFERETRAIAAVAHEHVVPIYAVDEYRKLPYFVMQYVPGCSLQQRLERSGSLQAKEIVRIGMQIAFALQAAHAQGIVHRDIKPANVLLENGLDRVLVTDFGLARIAGDCLLTQAGVIAGTPEYMSPEQSKGQDIDEQSDLFSLGSVMYTMCTGRTPFRSDNVYGIVHQICEEAPVSIRELNSDIPRWLEQFVMRLHAKQKVDRFRSAEQVADVLSAELAHLQNPSSNKQPSRAWTTHQSHLRKAAIGVGCLLLVFAAGFPFLRTYFDSNKGTHAPITTHGTTVHIVGSKSDFEKMIGKPAPPLPRVGWVGGKRPNVEGKPYLIHFWARWHGPSKTELSIVRELSQQGVTVVGMHTSTDERSVQKASEEAGLIHPTHVAFQRESAFIGGYPPRQAYCIIVDANGFVVGHGSLGIQKDRIIEQLVELGALP